MVSSLESSVVEHPLLNQSSVFASEMVNIKVQSATLFLQGEGNEEMPSLISAIRQMCNSGSI